MTDKGNMILFLATLCGILRLYCFLAITILLWTLHRLIGWLRTVCQIRVAHPVWMLFIFILLATSVLFFKERFDATAMLDAFPERVDFGASLYPALVLEGVAGIAGLAISLRLYWTLTRKLK